MKFKVKFNIKKTGLSFLILLFLVGMFFWIRYNSGNIILKKVTSQNGESLWITQREKDLVIENDQLSITLKNLSKNKNQETKIYYSKYEGKKKEEAGTKLIYFNDKGFDYSGAEIKIEKTDPDIMINKIVTCSDEDFNQELGDCENWRQTEINPVDHGEYITFETEHFSAYLGIAEPNGLVGFWPLDKEAYKGEQAEVEGYNILSAEYDSIFSVSDEDTAPQGIAFNTDGTKMFVVGDDGNDVSEYHCSTGFDIDTCDYDSSFSVTDEDTTPRGIAFNTNGTKMFVVGSVGDDINEYDCPGFSSSISTCTYNSLLDVSESGGEDYPQAINFNTDGTVMLLLGYSGKDVNEYHCSTGFDIDSCTYDSNFSVNDEDTAPRGMTFNTDGTKMFIMGDTGNDINKYNCSTGFDVSSCEYDLIFSVIDEETSPRGVIFNSDGSKVFVVGDVGEDVNEYHLDLPEPFKLFTADKTPYSNDGLMMNMSTSTAYTTDRFGKTDAAMTFDGFDGTEDYINTTYEPNYTASDDFSISLWFKSDDTSFAGDIALLGSLADTGTEDELILLEVDGDASSCSDDRLSFTVRDTDSASVDELCSTSAVDNTDWHHLVITYDVSGNMLFYLDNSLEDTTAITANSSGTKDFTDYAIYLASNNNQGSPSTYYDGALSDVKFYDRVLSSGEVELLFDAYRPKISAGSLNKGLVGYWALDKEAYKGETKSYDITSADYVDNLPISGQSATTGIEFNPDGTKMFISSYNGDDVLEYHCSTGYDISTCEYDSYKAGYILSLYNDTHDFTWSTDGTKSFWLLDGTPDRVQEYTCSTAFDVSTCSFVDSPSVNSGSPYGMDWSTDGTKMFVAEASEDDVEEYHCSTAFDMSTCSYDSQLDISDEETTVTSIKFSSDGEMMFIVGSSSVNDKVFKYICGTAFDVNTCSYTEDFFDVSDQDGSPQGVSFNTDGTKMFIIGGTTDDVFEYNLDPVRPITGDKTPYSNDGLMTNMSTSTAYATDRFGKTNAATTFDGTEDYINTTYEPNYTASDDFSISLWFKSDDTSFAGDIALLGSLADTDTNDELMLLEVDGDANSCSDDRLSFTVRDTDSASVDELCSTSAVDDTDWHHLAITYDVSGNMLLYLDNSLEDTTAVTVNSSGAKDFTDYAIYLASNNNQGSPSTYYDGALSDVKFYDRVLSSGEVELLFDSYRKKISAGSLNKGLVGYWSLDEQAYKGGSEEYDILNAEYSERHFDTSDSWPGGVVFNTDGTKLFIAAGFAGTIREYHCSTGFDLDSCTYDSAFDCDVGLLNYLNSVRFNADGTKMFTVVAASTDRVQEYHCLTGFDVSSCEHDSDLPIGTEEADPWGLAFSTDGTRMFVVGDSDDVNEYHCTTGYDISTCSADSVFSVSDEEIEPAEITFSLDGKMMFIVGFTENTVFKYECITAFDISNNNCSYTGDFVDISAQDSESEGLTFNSDGTKMFIIGGSSNDVFEYHLDPLVLFTADKTPYSNDGLMTNMSSATAYTTDRFGKTDAAMNFDGTEDYINTNYEPNYTDSDDFSISLWFKSDDTSFVADVNLLGSRAESGTYDAYLLLGIDGDANFCSDDRLIFRIKDSGGSSIDQFCGTSAVDDTDWHHLVITFDVDGNILLYLDNSQEGSLAVTAASSGEKDFTDYPFYISTLSNQGTPLTFYDGALSDVRIYNRVLSSNEIQLLYDSYK